MMIGFDLYLFYGMKHSILNKGEFSLKSYKTVAGSGLGMVLALIVIAFVHHSDPNVDDTFLFYFSLMFAALHALIYAYSFKKVR
jgi:APA family basic amino acid/polyamine antiporter